MADEIVDAVNRGVADLVRRRPDRLVGLGTVALQHPDLAATQLARAVTGLGLRGAGFGLAYGAMNHAAMEAVPRDERDRAGAILPAVAESGRAVGAGIGGAVAGASGLVTALVPGGAAEIGPFVVMVRGEGR